MSEHNSEVIHEKVSSEYEPNDEYGSEENLEVDEDFESEEVESDVSDNIGETSVEFNVDDLIAELEAERASQGHHECPRKKLEEILEQRRIARDLEDMDDFDVA
jgi:hypothetical protein